MPELKGVVVFIGEIQQIGESFVKQEIVLEYAENPTYPEQIVFEFHGQNVDKIMDTGTGEEITIHYNLRGREWANAPKEKGRKWFNTLVGWKVDVNRSQPHTQPAGANNNKDEEDDLPF